MTATTCRVSTLFALTQLACADRCRSRGARYHVRGAEGRAHGLRGAGLSGSGLSGGNGRVGSAGSNGSGAEALAEGTGNWGGGAVHGSGPIESGRCSSRQSTTAATRTAAAPNRITMIARLRQRL
jgi:hypothetical protein